MGPSLLNSGVRSWKGFRAIALLLAVAIFAASVANAAGPARPANPVKLKQTLTKRGLGREVTVKKVDGTKVVGVLTAIHDDSFEINAYGSTPQAVSLPYAQVSGVHIDAVGHGGVGFNPELLLVILPILMIVVGVVGLAVSHGK